MNKELIKKYKAEFDHYLNGGKLLYNCGDVWIEVLSGFRWDNDVRDDYQFIIYDEYVEYRKALAEGKTIQYYVDGFVGWQDVTSMNQSCRHPSSFRIKPEEPKFKIGDWVTHNGKYKRVTKTIDGYIDSLDNQVAVIMKEESLELWKPNAKEYFWYKNDLVKFDEIKTNGTLLKSARGRSYYASEESFKDFCEPFIGQLPTFLES